MTNKLVTYVEGPHDYPLHLHHSLIYVGGRGCDLKVTVMAIVCKCVCWSTITYLRGYIVVQRGHIRLKMLNTPNGIAVNSCEEIFFMN